MTPGPGGGGGGPPIGGLPDQASDVASAALNMVGKILTASGQAIAEIAGSIGL